MRSKSRDSIIAHNRKKRHPPLLVFWDQVVKPKSLTEDDLALTQRRMLLTYTELVQHSANIFKKWFSLYRDIHKSSSGYFGTLYSEHTYIDTKFISLITSIEGYHRTFPAAQEYRDTHTLERIDKICDILEEDDTNWIRKQLKYACEPSLKYRLSETCGMCWGLMQELNINTEKFLSSVVDTRNQKLHGLPKKHRQILEGLAMFEANLILAMLIQCSILYRLGLSPNDIVNRFKRTKAAFQIHHFRNEGRHTF